MQRLPEAELEVMLAVWDAGQEVGRPALEGRLGHRSWNANTLNTLLARLQEKGFLQSRREGRGNLYWACITQAEYQRFEGETLLDKLYGSSLTNFVAALADGGTVDEAEMAALRRYLAQLGGESHDE